MSCFVPRATAVAVLSCLTSGAFAATTFDGTGFTLGYDDEAASYSYETTSFGGINTEYLTPGQVSYTASASGLEVGFLNGLGVYATSYTDFTPQTLSGAFHLPMTLSAAPGYVLTGYTLTIEGNYSIETPGSVDVAGLLYATSGIEAFSVSGFTPFAGGSTSVSGSFSAIGDISFVTVLDGYDEVETCTDPLDPSTCTIEQVPRYREEMDLGEAYLNIERITITPQVAAVPEPETLALVLAGAGVLAGLRGRGAVTRNRARQG
jgi:hypothetical protein